MRDIGICNYILKTMMLKNLFLIRARQPALQSLTVVPDLQLRIGDGLCPVLIGVELTIFPRFS
jgi:hypothetical protein